MDPPNYGIQLANLGSNSLFIQPKLSINPPDDKYEREADQMAEQVIQRMSISAIVPTIQRQTLAEDKRTIQRKCNACEEEKTIQPKLISNLQISNSKTQRVQRKCNTCQGEESIQLKSNSNIHTNTNAT